MRISKLPWVLLTCLTSAASLPAMDLVNNLEGPALGTMVIGEMSYGLSIRTGLQFTSPHSLTLKQCEGHHSPLVVRVFQVTYQGGATSAELTEVGQFVATSLGKADGDLCTPVIYEPAAAVLLAPDSEYLFLVEIHPAGGVQTLALASTREAGSMAGWTLISDWYFFPEMGFPVPVSVPLQMHLQGSIVEVGNRPPEVAAAEPSLAMLWPPNGALIPIEILGVVDPDGDPVTVRITEVLQDEPVTWPAPNRRTPDAVVNDEGLWLRAERLRSGSGRVYTVHFEATDGKPGGLSTGSIRVTVPIERKVSALDDGPTGGYYDSTRTSLSGETVR
jgi:hypothetical protein